MVTGVYLHNSRHSFATIWHATTGSLSVNPQLLKLLWVCRLLIPVDDSSLSTVTMPQKRRLFATQQQRKAFFLELQRRQVVGNTSTPWVQIPKH